MLALTDHSGHSAENSLYAFAKVLSNHPMCAQMDVATRGNPYNDPFFKAKLPARIQARPVNRNFKFRDDGHAYEQRKKIVSLHDYDVIWLRLPPPIPESFLNFLATAFPKQLFINDPRGIWETGSKGFLTAFPELCAPMEICTSVEDIQRARDKYPIVLKPMRAYGGQGIVRIDGDKAWVGKEEMPLSSFLAQLDGQEINYLAVKFLKNVDQGDKRLVVVNGKIMGASLRLPPKDSWICNVAMGGSSNQAEADADEQQIVKRLHPVLRKKGILMYGIDTLVGDDGRRLLSEINTTSIGGLPQIAQQNGKPLVEEASELIWNYIAKKSKTNVD